MKRYILIAVAMLLVAPAQGAPVELLTVNYDGHNFAWTSPPVVDLYFNSWTNRVSVDNIGQTISIPANLIPIEQANLNHDPIKFAAANPVQNNSWEIPELPPYEPLSVSQPGYNYSTTVHVDDLRRYLVTDITRTLVNLELPQIGKLYFEAIETIRFYGERVPPLPGDFTEDHKVDAADYVMWRDRVLDSGPLPNGTGIGVFAGLAIEADYGLWRANFGRTSWDALQPVAQLNRQPIPEPATLALVLGLATLGIFSRYGHEVLRTPST